MERNGKNKSFLLEIYMRVESLLHQELKAYSSKDWIFIAFFDRHFTFITIHQANIGINNILKCFYNYNMFL